VLRFENALAFAGLGICFSSFSNQIKPAAAGFAEFTLQRSEGLSMTDTLFQQPARLALKRISFRGIGSTRIPRRPLSL
jgi:hypothetical protein